MLLNQVVCVISLSISCLMINILIVESFGICHFHIPSISFLDRNSLSDQIRWRFNFIWKNPSNHQIRGNYFDLWIIFNLFQITFQQTNLGKIWKKIHHSTCWINLSEEKKRWKLVFDQCIEAYRRVYIVCLRNTAWIECIVMR